MKRRMKTTKSGQEDSLLIKYGLADRKDQSMLSQKLFLNIADEKKNFQNVRKV